MGYFDMKTFLKTFLADESGASAAEYALILVVVGIGIVASGLLLTDAIADSMRDASECIDTGTAAGCTRNPD
jgi:pilus assembly protein Flp/PilA